MTATWQQVDNLQVLNALGKIASPVINMGETLANITVTFKNEGEQFDFSKHVAFGMTKAGYRQDWILSHLS